MAFYATSYGGTSAIDGTKHHYDKTMSKSQSSGTYISLTSPKTAWWYAENAAQCDLSFGTDSWIVHIYHDKMDKPEEYGATLTADIYKVTADGAAMHIATGSESPTQNSVDTAITCYPVGSQDFATGERFAVRISWSPTSDNLGDPLRIYYSTDKTSTLTSPASDPGYPTSEIPIPEFTTIAIPIAIVLGLMFLFHRRKEKG